MPNMDPKKCPMPSQEPNVRNKNFKEVALGYTEEMAINEAKRCLQCKNHPCRSGCPVEIDIPGFIKHVAEGDFEAAYNVIAQSSALPAVCGRVCPQEHQCEGKCVRGIKGESVGIGRLERFVADWYRNNVHTKPVAPAPNGHKVAVIGAGPSGLTVVIVREDLIGNARPETPVMLNYKTQADNESMYNTPPCYAIYIAGLVYEWALSLGGLEEMEKRNRKKAAVLYDYLDGSSLFKPTAEKPFRSMMNVCFVTGDPELDKKFCAEAGKAGFVNIKGHRSVGGMRASIYNAMPIEGVEKLVDFMKKFESENR